MSVTNQSLEPGQPCGQTDQAIGAEVAWDNDASSLRKLPVKPGDGAFDVKEGGASQPSDLSELGTVG